MQTQTKKGVKIQYRPHVRVHKPHGSLDWFQFQENPVRTQLDTRQSRLIICPGRTKYIRGYEQPFDIHRERANRAIDQASKLLILGYGFNDQQLETHLQPRAKSGVPCLLLTRDLTDNAVTFLDNCPDAIALSKSIENEQSTLVQINNTSDELENSSLWNLSEFCEKVLV